MGLALEEPHKTDNTMDQLFENSGVNIVFEKKISPYINDKIIDYQEGYSPGFTIYSQRGRMGCN